MYVTFMIKDLYSHYFYTTKKNLYITKSVVYKYLPSRFVL